MLIKNCTECQGCANKHMALLWKAQRRGTSAPSSGFNVLHITIQNNRSLQAYILLIRQ